MKSRKYFSLTYISAALVISFLFGGCASLAEKGGRLLEGSARGEKINARYRYGGNVAGIIGFELREIKNKSGEFSTIILLDQFPAVKLRGSAPDSRGNFHLSSLEYLGGTLSGWNEFTLDLSAEALFARDPDGGGLLMLSSSLDPVQISAAGIRRSGSRITGDQALTNLRNRHDRIQALVEWMKEQEGVPVTALKNQKSFEAYWKPILLPELVSKKHRPPSWQTKTAGVKWERAEDINWNVTYTESLLSEELRPLRNSGALLRDWEEAPGWIYLEYSRNSIEEALQTGINLYQIVKK